ncbi:Uncharacterised protein [Bordetella pertussis]|nr:Uncharacterised protein [Bordetella pertussis]CFP65839.1 Uncharacterised protein [Bordetella pertussis]CFW39662.1 Uncharacterised protein [Bordetella pertussis]
MGSGGKRVRMRAGSGCPCACSAAGPGLPAHSLPWKRFACRSSSMIGRRKLLAAGGVGAWVILKE